MVFWRHEKIGGEITPVSPMTSFVTMVTGPAFVGIFSTFQKTTHPDAWENDAIWLACLFFSDGMVGSTTNSKSMKIDDEMMDFSAKLMWWGGVFLFFRSLCLTFPSFFQGSFLKKHDQDGRWIFLKTMLWMEEHGSKQAGVHHLDASHEPSFTSYVQTSVESQ